ncbi:hypothetical protein MTO96_044593 [Rhipicephalus appendiculatus]
MTRPCSTSMAEESARRRAPQDQCWIVPFCVALSAFLLVMVSSCTGYVIVLFREKYGVNHQRASWLASTLVIAMCFSGLVVSQLQRKISIYHISLMGACLASAGLVASAFAPNIAWMTFTFGIMYGTGLGTALLGLCVYLLLYFDEYRGTATAIMWIFRATSGMAGMPLLWHLTGNYGVQGCLLVMGGLVMHCVPIIMLIKSPQPCHLFIRNKTCQSKVYTRGKKICENADTETSEAVSSSDQELHQCATLEGTVTTSWLRTALASFTSLPFCVLVIQSVVSEYAFVSSDILIVAYSVDKGFELHQGNQAVMYSAVGLLIGRIVVPYATDKISFSRCPVAALCYSVAGVCMLSLPWIQSFSGVVALTIVKGVAQGYILCIKTVLIADYVGVAGVSFCCGVAGLVKIPVWLFGPSIIGFFRDKKGSYDLLFVTFSALCFIVATLLLYLTWRDASRRKRRKRGLAHDETAGKKPLEVYMTAKLKDCSNC